MVIAVLILEAIYAEIKNIFSSTKSYLQWVWHYISSRNWFDRCFWGRVHLYVGKVWVGVAPRKLFQTQSEEPYLVRWAVFCEAVECGRSRHRLASDGLNHVLILTTVLQTVVPMKGVGSGATPLKRYQVVVRGVKRTTGSTHAPVSRYRFHNL